MKSLQLRAFAVTNELDLNSIAVKCGIPKKYTWEEPLILQGAILENILKKSFSDDAKVMLFSFGSVVFINMPETELSSFITYLRTFKPEIDIRTWDLYNDDYELRKGNVGETELNDKYAVLSSFDPVYPELAAIIIAKSVALEKTEDMLGRILDKLEAMIDRLEAGRLRIGDRELAGATARVARHQYNTINYIMILDKPDITWSNSAAGEFYERMSQFFELNDRFVILTKKTDILNNIISGFSSISRSIRGLFIEWIIVILIVIEVILMVADLLR